MGYEGFRDWIDFSSLVDLLLTRRKYSWGRGNVRSRIDRCLIDPIWHNTFPSIILKRIDNAISDHVALVVHLTTPHGWGPKPFRSLNTWFTHPNFKKFVSEEWRNLSS